MAVGAPDIDGRAPEVAAGGWFSQQVTAPLLEFLPAHRIAHAALLVFLYAVLYTSPSTLEKLRLLCT